jgi:plasmid stabilization system protein ParE
VARVEITARAFRNLERLFDFVAEVDPDGALAQLSRVRAAFELLADNPPLGRVAEDGRRELVLYRGKYGCVAKYRWLPDEEVVLTLAVRHQIEAGCTEASVTDRVRRRRNSSPAARNWSASSETNPR